MVFWALSGVDTKPPPKLQYNILQHTVPLATCLNCINSSSRCHYLPIFNGFICRKTPLGLAAGGFLCDIVFILIFKGANCDNFDIFETILIN